VAIDVASARQDGGALNRSAHQAIGGAALIAVMMQRGSL
jgi:hypothetical protein